MTLEDIEWECMSLDIARSTTRFWLPHEERGWVMSRLVFNGRVYMLAHYDPELDGWFMLVRGPARVFDEADIALLLATAVREPPNPQE